MKSTVIRQLVVAAFALTLAIAPVAAAPDACGTNGTPCDDGNACTLNDTCVNNVCVGGAPPPAIRYCTPYVPDLITIPSGPGAASPYPYSINVNAGPTVCKVSLSFSSISHTNPDDMDIMLSGPGGQNAKIWSDAGGTQDIGNLSQLLDDDAASFIPDGGPMFADGFGDEFGGTNRKPTDINDGVDTFPAPAPLPMGGSAFGVFKGTNPNGTWNLWVVDDKSLDAGSIWGWCLRISFLCNSNSQCADDNPCTDDSCVNGICANAFQQAAPPEVQGVAVAADKSTISWSPMPGAQSYDVVRGGISDLSFGAAGDTCFDDVATTSISDATLPPDGKGDWYLVRAMNCYDNGTYGTQSNGTPRGASVCP
jgi:hypothetical protein